MAARCHLPEPWPDSGISFTPLSLREDLSAVLFRVRGSSRVESGRYTGCSWLFYKAVKANAHLNYQKQLVAINAAAPIDIIEFEVPAELLLHSSFQHQAQSGDILHEINEAILQEK